MSEYIPNTAPIVEIAHHGVSDHAAAQMAIAVKLQRHVRPILGPPATGLFPLRRQNRSATCRRSTKWRRTTRSGPIRCEGASGPALSPAGHAGRAYAVHACIYLVASPVWLRAVEGQRPDQWDLVGATVCLVGAAIILWAPRGG